MGSLNKIDGLYFDEVTLRFQITAHSGSVWQWAEHFEPYFKLGEEKVLFRAAGTIRHEAYHSGLGEGIYSTYEHFVLAGESSPLAFATLVWRETVSGEICFEWIPLAEDARVTAVFWPGPMDFCHASRDWYTLLPFQQGLLIPNDWPEALGHVSFNGMFGTAGAYLPVLPRSERGRPIWQSVRRPGMQVTKHLTPPMDRTPKLRFVSSPVWARCANVVLSGISSWRMRTTPR